MNRISQFISKDGKSQEDFLFKGSPCFVTRIIGGVCHIILLPGDVPMGTLYEFARQQTQANKLPACLVLTPYHAAYLSPYEEEVILDNPPPLTVVVTHKLKPCVDFQKSDEFKKRERALEEFEESHPYFEDLIDGIGSKGSRDATPYELARLQGDYPTTGIPRGLVRCEVCNLQEGECLDPCVSFKGKIMKVNCLCKNDNLCAACGRKLYSYRLNSNFYNEGDGHIWHVPGFCAFDHKC